MCNFGLEPDEMEKISAVRGPTTWESSMAVEIPSSKKAAGLAEYGDVAQFHVYTDGSGIDGRIGASAVLFEYGVEVSSLRLCLGSAEDHTVFEGEGIGGVLAMVLLGEIQELWGPVSIIVDSQPAVHATHTNASTLSHWIWDLWHKYARALARLHPDAEVKIRWAPGHVGIAGNERADVEAKTAAQQVSSSNPDELPPSLWGVLPRSQSAARQTFNVELKVAVARDWEKSPQYT
jgi:ribonuclease HI